MKRFLINIDHLRAAYLFQAKGDPRTYLNGIHLNGCRIESTNGHVAYMASDRLDKPEWCRQVSVSCKMTVQLCEKIPANNKIKYALIEQESDTEALVKYFDELGRRLCVGSACILEGRFPNIPKLIADVKRTEKNTNPIGLNTQYIGLIDKAFTRKDRYPMVKVDFFDMDRAVVFTKQKLVKEIIEIAVIMPAKL